MVEENAVIEKVIAYLKKRVDISDIFLFGSITTGNFTEDSDIDIALYIKNYETYSLKDFARILFHIQDQFSSRIELHFFPDKAEPLTFPDYIRNTGKKVA
ncbi:MAG: nucleotidyltransferase domain-containing protein [Candidatus Aminicenantes bacterium]|nr:nucleotidyltransferase domain-containing protein [Candidatus Aminicenantes bacterium]